PHPRPTAIVAPPGCGARLPAAPPRQGCAGVNRPGLRTRLAQRALDRRARRDVRADDSGRRRDLLGRLGGGCLQRVLDGRRRRVHERVHVRRQLPDRVPDRSLLALGAQAARLRRTARVRRVLPVALHSRKGRSAGTAACGRLRRTVRRGRSVPRRRYDLALRRPPLPERGRMIEVENLTKSFVVGGGFRRRDRRVVDAVQAISFRVERGELLGYLGPNGAGKSTTIKMLTGILVPTSGRVSVAGLDPSRKRIELAKRIGAMFGQRVQLWWDLPLRDSFELLRHIYRV